MLSSLTQSNYPKAALGLEKDSITALSLKREGRGQVGIRQAATIELPANLLTPSFTETNISNSVEMANMLEDVLTAAGLLRQKRWSVSLPSNTARTAILTIDTDPASRAELNEIIDWKAENTFGAPAVELRISARKISPDISGRTRYFATAVKLGVIDEYETLFESFGWQAGLILPRALSEAKWLVGSKSMADSLLISTQSDGFVALLLRGEEPTVVRSVTCTDDETDDEIYRLLMFYRDRFGDESGDYSLKDVLVIGNGLTPARVTEIADEALGKRLKILLPEDVGLLLPSGDLSFYDVAAPAGLASLGWRF